MAKKQQATEEQAAVPARDDEQGAEKKDPEQLRAEIEETREDLGDTVEALAGKADVKTQAKEKVSEAKERFAGKREEFTQKAREGTPESFDPDQAVAYAKQNPIPVGIAALVLVFLIGRASKRS